MSPLQKLKLVYRKIYEISYQSMLSQLRNLPIESSLAYWKQKFADAPELLSLPTDRPRLGEQTFKGSSQSFVLSQELTESLNLLSKQKEVTLFMTLLAAFKTLLYRYTNTKDIIVGSPIANHLDSAAFVNAVALRTDMSGNPQFIELLKQVQEVTLLAQNHGNIPLELLIEELQLQRDLSYSPIFQVMFAFQEDVSLQKIELSNLTASPWVLEDNEGKFDITLLLEQTNNGLAGKWLYNTDLFNADTIERMNGHFQTLLEGIVSNPEQAISELPLLSVKEKQQLLVEWNDTATEYPQDKCVHQLFEEYVDLTPDAIAVVWENQQLTYRELNNRANQLANYLQKLGVKPDSLVGICIERSLDMIVGLLGILKAGGAYVPIDPNYPQDRIEYMFDNAQVRVLLTQQQILANLPIQNIESIEVVCVDTDSSQINQESQETPVCSVTPDSIAYINYTSGSTGKPKGVETPHRGITRLLFGVDYIPFNAENKFLQMAPISFDAATLEIWGALLYGAQCVLFGEKIPTATDLKKAIQKHNITTVWLTSALFNLIIDTDPTALEGLLYSKKLNDVETNSCHQATPYPL